MINTPCLPLAFRLSIHTYPIQLKIHTYRVIRRGKDVHMVVPLAYLSSLYSKFERAENPALQAYTKQLSGKQIFCTTKSFL